MLVWAALIILVAQGNLEAAPQGGGLVTPPASVAADSGDSATRAKRAARLARRAALRAARDVPLTPALLSSAYDGDSSRALIARAREARAEDDSAIRRYDATSLERFTVQISIGSLGRQRMVFRRERAERVRWQRGRGAIVDVSGSRAAVPLVDDAQVMDEEAISLPYVPGRRTLSLGGQRGADTTEYTEIDDIIDPLTNGAEAYYRYTAGDSATIRMPRAVGPEVIRLREIRLHARRPIWNLAVGSLWFDASSGHLVRAVYRFATPMNIVAIAKDADPHAFDKVPIWIRPVMTPLTANLSAVTLEYGLLEGRYWLPVTRFADGEARVGPMRLPVRWQVRHRYASVNGPDTLPRTPELDADTTRQTDSAKGGAGPPQVAAASSGPPLQVPTAVGTQPTPLETSAQSGKRQSSATRVTMRSGAAKRGEPGSERQKSHDSQCAHGSLWERVEVHDGGAARVLVRTPCDTVALARSPDLGGSIYDNSDSRFGVTDQVELLRVLGTGPTPDWAPRPVELLWGPRDGLIRYNRIEGLSAGVGLAEDFGLGLSGRAEGRLGIADLQPNGELRVQRETPLGTIGLGVYRRLSVATDWGDPLSLGNSIWNLLVGDDEGFYYRSWGGEVRGERASGSLPFTWRLFAEKEWSATVRTHFAITRAFGGAGMSRRNLEATAGTLTGVSFRVRPTWGVEPDGWQGSADLRGEGAGGTFSYVRGAADVTITHPLGSFAVGALTAGAGTSAGDMPPQRLWYLGGLRTVRGLAPGTEVGDAYWMARAELGTRGPTVRPVAFFDMGWAGHRSAWGHEGRPLSGAGIGVSFLDGLVRIDVAKGIWPTHAVRCERLPPGGVLTGRGQRPRSQKGLRLWLSTVETRESVGSRKSTLPCLSHPR